MIIATLLAAAFLTALIIIGLAAIRVATTREYRAGRLQARATTRLAAMTRKITGLYVEIPAAHTRPGQGRQAVGVGAMRPELPSTRNNLPHTRDDR